jgi:hypothetical protein
MGWSLVTMSGGWVGAVAGFVSLPLPSFGGGLAGVLTDDGGTIGVLADGGGTAGITETGGAVGVLVDGGGTVGVLVDGGGGAGLLVGGGDMAGVLTDGDGTAGAARVLGAAARTLGGSAGVGTDMTGRVCVRENSAAGSSSTVSKCGGSLSERCRSHRSRHECQVRCGCCDDQDPKRAIIHGP